MMYLDRKNLPPTFGEMIKMERKEAEEKGIFTAKRKLALNLIQGNFSDEYISEWMESTVEEVNLLRNS